MLEHSRFPRCTEFLGAAGFLLIVAACGNGGADAGDTESGDSVTSDDLAQYDAIIDSALQQVKKHDAASFPCSVFTSEEVASMIGMPVDSGSYTFVNRSEDDVEWKSESCAWSTTEDANTVVDIWVSLPAHFTSGKAECHAMVGAATVTGLGNAAWWQYFDGYGLGTLRVCTDAALLEVKIDRGKSATEAQTQETARHVAVEILARLPAATGQAG